jgi:hypothetical protein
MTAFHDTLNPEITIVRLFTSVTNPYIWQIHIIFLVLEFRTLFKFKGQNRKKIVLYSFYKSFCRTCLLYNACDKMVSYKTRIINYYFGKVIFASNRNLTLFKHV